MASLQESERQLLPVLLRYQRQAARLHHRPVTEAEAEAKAAQVDYLLMRLKQRLIELPPGIGIVEFVRHDGKAPRCQGRSP